MANEVFVSPNKPLESFDMNNPEEVKELLCKCVDNLEKDGFKLREISSNPTLIMPEFSHPRNIEEWMPRVDGFEIHLKFRK